MVGWRDEDGPGPNPNEDDQGHVALTAIDEHQYEHDAGHAYRDHEP